MSFWNVYNIEKEIKTKGNCKWITFAMFIFKSCLNRSDFVTFHYFILFIFFSIFTFLTFVFSAGMELKFKDSLAICDSMPNKHETRLLLLKNLSRSCPRTRTRTSSRTVSIECDLVGSRATVWREAPRACYMLDRAARRRQQGKVLWGTRCWLRRPRVPWISINIWPAHRNRQLASIVMNYWNGRFRFKSIRSCSSPWLIAQIQILVNSSWILAVNIRWNGMPRKACPPRRQIYVNVRVLGTKAHDTCRPTVHVVPVFTFSLPLFLPVTFAMCCASCASSLDIASSRA